MNIIPYIIYSLEFISLIISILIGTVQNKKTKTELNDTKELLNASSKDSNYFSNLIDIDNIVKDVCTEIELTYPKSKYPNIPLSDFKQTLAVSKIQAFLEERGIHITTNTIMHRINEYISNINQFTNKGGQNQNDQEKNN